MTPPTRVVLVLASCALASFIAGARLADGLVVKLAPYWIFGAHQAIQDKIKVTANTRHSIAFSNGVTLHGKDVLPFLILWAATCAVLMPLFWIVLVRAVVWALQKSHVTLGDEVLALWKSIWQRPSS